MQNLAEQQCQPVSLSDPLLSAHDIERLLDEDLHDLWLLDHRRPVIQREFRFNDFHQTMDFVNKLAEIIHQQDHHPEIQIGYNRCLVEYTTHSINNLSINDFICAAKINQIPL